LKKNIIIWLLITITGIVLVSEACRKHEGLPPGSDVLQFTIPAGFPEPAYNFQNNTPTQQGFDLGRKLFYDGQLSVDGNFPCASCHQQFAAFSTFDHPRSHGFNNQFTLRNAPGLFNMAWVTQGLHWDGGVNNLEVQPLAPLTAPNEMAETVENVVNKLKADPAYPGMFKAAFGDETINSQRMLKAIAQFVGMMISADSKYDRVKKGQEQFSPEEQGGYATFQAKCAVCHAEPLFTDNSFRNTGLPINEYLNDFGRMRITNKPEDSLKFKVPSLRNVNITGPYGHDGRFYSIGAVIDHYRFSVVDGPTTDPIVKNGIPMSDDEKDNLILFLRTLTDTTFVNNTRFSQPE